MESVWHYVANGEPVGPVTWDELRAVATAGKIAPDDLVWRDGTPEWVAARTVAGLLPAPAVDARPARTGSDGTYALSPSAPPPRAAELLTLDDEPRPRRKRERDRERETEGPAPAAPTPEWVLLAKVLALRAVAPDPSAVVPTDDEGAALTAAGVMDVTARKLAVWRRSVLFAAAVPSAVAALFGFVAVLAMDRETRGNFTAFGMMLQFVQALTLFALPAAAVLGALAYDRLSVSTKWVLAGGLVSLAVPLAVAFAPTSWVIDFKTNAPGPERAFMGMVMGILYYLALMPAVLSLLPAAARACVRMKLLLPESLVPGWGLITSVPLCVLLTLATFVVLYHVASSTFLLLGLALWIGAPLVYFTRFDLLTRPLTNPADRAAVARTSQVVLGLAASGLVLLLIYIAFVAEFMGKPVLGFGDDALVRPWSPDLHKIWIDFVGRSLFLTVFFSDLLLRVALSVWREERAFAAGPGAAGFDRTMSGLGSAVLTRGGGVV